VSITIELWQLVSFLGTVASVLGVFGKLLLKQMQRALDQRFHAVEDQADAWRRLERDFLGFKADLAVQYVRREDYVRGQSVIEAKLDAIASELKRVQIDQSKQGKSQ